MIARRRTGASALGFALQLGTVRYLGRFLEDPAEVPAGVAQWTAREIGVPIGTDLTAYGRGEWRWSHQEEIRHEYGYQPFGAPGVEDELAAWLHARAWVSAESHLELFARAVEHLMGSKVLLPGASTLWRLIGTAREHADERGWTMLAATISDEQRVRLEGLLAVIGGRRESELERLRRPAVEPTAAGLIAALERLRELRVVAAGLSGLQASPVARVRALMVAAATRRAGDLAKMSDTRRLATLAAFAILPPSAARTTRLSTLTGCTANCSSGCASRASANASATERRSTAQGWRWPTRAGCCWTRRRASRSLRRCSLASTARGCWRRLPRSSAWLALRRTARGS